MSIRLQAALDCLSQAGGQRLAEANNIGVVEQMGRFGMNRSKGSLYVLVEAAGAAKSETERQLVDILAGEYEHAPGSITASLRQAIAAANRWLFTNNQKALPEMRMAAGVTCAVIRETDVFLAQAGPALAYVLHQDTFQRSPVDSPWLSPDRAAAFPYMFPLGKRAEVDPELFHSPLQPGDTLLLSTVALAQRIPQAQVKQILSKGPVTLITRQVATLAGREDFSAVALEITEQAEEEELAEGEVVEEGAGGGGPLGRLREEWQALTHAVGGVFGRALQPLRGRGEPEAIDVPEMAPAPRAVPVLRTEGGEPVQDMLARSVPAKPYPPEGSPPPDAQQPYSQSGFLEDVVPPRGPRPLVDRPPLGTAYETEPPSAPWSEEGAAGQEEWEAEGYEEAAPGRFAAVGAALAGVGGRLRGLTGRFRGRAKLEDVGTEQEYAPEGMALTDAEEGTLGDERVAAGHREGGTGSLVGVPWRESTRPDAVETPAEVEEPSERRFRLSLPRLGGRAPIVGVGVLALAAILVGGLAFVRYQEDQEKGRQFSQFMVVAQERRGQVSPSTDRATARTALDLAQKAVNEALALRPDDAEAKTLSEGIQASLDSVNLVVRLTNLTTLVEVPETQSKLGRIIVNGIDLFFLDAGQNRIYKYLLTASGAPAIQKLDVNPVLVRTGDEVGNFVARDMVDIVWMPAGGARRAAQFIALESGGNLMAYDPGAGMQPMVVRDSETWRKVRSISSFQGNFYVMDTQQNKILKYEPTARGYENAPQEWLKAAVDLTNMVDMAIDGDIYLLALDGKIQRFRGGLALPYTQPDLDRPVANPSGLFTSVETQSLYVVDSANKRIVQLGKDGGFQRQYQYGGKDGAFDALRSVYVNEAQGRMYITSGKKVLVASIAR